MDAKFRILKFINGRYGYKSWYELQRYNPVYRGWYSEKSAIQLEFIESHCILHDIDYKSLEFYTV